VIEVVIERSVALSLSKCRNAELLVSFSKLQSRRWHPIKIFMVSFSHRRQLSAATLWYQK